MKVPFEVASGRGLSTFMPSLKSGPVKGVVTASRTEPNVAKLDSRYV